jgi:hypothetical protein
MVNQPRRKNKKGSRKVPKQNSKSLSYVNRNINFVCKTVSQAAAATLNGGLYVGRYHPLHPNYGVNGGSIIQSTLRSTIVNSAGGISGYFLRFIIRRCKMTFTVTNNEAHAVHIIALPVASINAVASFQVSNLGTLLLGRPMAKMVTLGDSTLVSRTKVVSVTIDLASLEGISPSALEQQVYWNTNSVISTQQPLVYLQAYPVDGNATFNTGLGISYSVDQEYQCMALQPSQAMTQ